MLSQRWLRCLLLGAALLHINAARSAINREDDDAAHAAEIGLYHLSADPLAAVDTFDQLASPQRAYWSGKHIGSVQSLLDELTAPLEVTVSIELKLVGFDGRG